jgi:hypothetical protein
MNILSCANIYSTLLQIYLEHAGAQFVEVAGSIHSNSSWTQSFRQNYDPRAAHSVRQMSNRYISLGGDKVCRYVGLTTLPPSCAMS